MLELRFKMTGIRPRRTIQLLSYEEGLAADQEHRLRVWREAQKSGVPLCKCGRPTMPVPYVPSPWSTKADRFVTLCSMSEVPPRSCPYTPLPK